MPRGDLQEMEVSTKQSKTAVNAKAGAPDAMPKLTTGGIPPNVEDLGGPSPDNYKPDDDSAKLKPPGATLKQVKDVVNKGAKAADPAKGMKEEEEVSDESVIDEEEVTTDEVVAEGEDTTDEVVSEEEATEEEVVEEESEPIVEFNIDDDVNALLEGEELSEEFQEKAKTIFEAVVTDRVNTEVKALQESFELTLTEEVEKVKTELAEKVDDYLTYAAETWLKENALQVEHGVRVEMAESFFDGLKKLFVEQNFTVPEEKFNLLDGMAEELNDMETKLNEQIDTNVSLNKRIGEFVKMEIVNECATGLAETQKEKLVSLAEGVEFETEADFKSKVETIKESYFTRKAEVVAETTEPTEEGSAPLVEETTSGTMSKYVDALSRWSK